MMRSLYSGVSGLKTHQTKMDVIGNNIANVNTVAFKSSNVTFSDIMYQTTSSASGPNDNVGGINAKQIGLGVTTGATSVNIASQGAAQTTGGAFDIRLSDSSSSTSFFVVNNGSQNLFTRAGSFYVDGAGNLCMASTGYQVMGWQADPTTGEIRKDTVSALQIMNEENMTSPAEATTNGYCGGIMDSNDTDVTSENGYTMSLNFYDALGYAYNAKFAVKSTGQDGKFTVELSDVLDSNGNSILGDADKAEIFGTNHSATATPSTAASYTCKLKPSCTALAARDVMNAEGTASAGSFTIFSDGTDSYAYNGTTFSKVTAITAENGTVSYRMGDAADASISLSTFYNVPAGSTNENITINTTSDTTLKQVTATKEGVFHELTFNPSNGQFTSIGDGGANVNLNMSVLGGNFSNISIDFTGCKTGNNSGTTTMGVTKGQSDGKTGTGKKLGNMIGLSVSNDGKIYGTYDNGNKSLLGQIAVAQFANASGLEKVGDNCYSTTLNSGEFDGIGTDITASGGSMASGELEMSNVDLSTEFTEMITTQRGFQANSRIITTSDSMLEELVNLKR